MTHNRKSAFNKAYIICHEILELDKDDDVTCTVKETGVRTNISIQRYGTESTTYSITKSNQTVRKQIKKDLSQISTNKKRNRATEHIDESVTEPSKKEQEQSVFHMNTDLSNIDNQSHPPKSLIINVKEASESNRSKSKQMTPCTNIKSLPETYEASNW